MILEPGERSHPLWQKIERHLNERLATLRVQNDAPADQDKTSHKRGQIEEVKNLLAIGQEPEEIKIDHDFR